MRRIVIGQTYADKTGRLEVRKRSCVAKHAGHRWRAVGERAHLEVRTPLRFGGGDSELGRIDEAKTTVEAWTAEESDQRLPRPIGGADDGVHQGVTGALALMVGSDAERAEAQRGELADPPPRADH